MTLYHVWIGSRNYRVEITDDHLSVNGEKEEVSLTPLNGGGLYLLRRGNQNRELHALPRGRQGFDITSDGRRVITQVEKGYCKAIKEKENQHEGDLVAPMPGMVINVVAKPGQEVERGQLLIVLESMKMQMELRAPVAGRVSEMPVKTRALVEKGALLARLAPV